MVEERSNLMKLMCSLDFKTHALVFLCTWRRGDTHGHSMELFVWLVLDSSIGHHPTINKFYV
jgi:hypothetical protein